MLFRALLMVAPLVTVLGAAPVQASEAAAPRISPANGSVVTSPNVTISVKTATGGGTLYVDGRRIGYGKNKVLSTKINGRTTPNGTHTVRLDAMIPWDAASSTFRMAVPALAPSGLTVTASGKKVTVRWNKGPEPDLSGYTVSGDLGTKSVAAGACGSKCSVTFASSGTASGRATVSVVAKRAGAEASGASSRTVKVTASPDSNGGGGNGNAPQPSAPDYTYQPPAQAPDYPSVAPDDSVFSEESPAVGEFYPTPDTAASGDMIILDGEPTAADSLATESLQWGKSLAIALVLLLCAAHLGTWTRRLRTARAGPVAVGPRSAPGSAHARVAASRRHIEAAVAAARGDAPSSAQTKRSRRKRKASAESAPVEQTQVLETPEGELLEELNLEYTPRPLGGEPDDAPAPAPFEEPADDTPADLRADDPDGTVVPTPDRPETQKYDAALAALIDMAGPRDTDLVPEASAADLTEVLEHPRPRRKGLRRRR